MFLFFFYQRTQGNGTRQAHLCLVPLKCARHSGGFGEDYSLGTKGGWEFGRVKKTQALCVCELRREVKSEECGIKKGQAILWRTLSAEE